MKRNHNLTIAIVFLFFSFSASIIAQTGKVDIRTSSDRPTGSRLKVSVQQLAIALQPTSSSTGSKKTIAVLAFQAADINPKFVQQVQDFLVETVFDIGKYKIIERESLDRILKEQNLQVSGIVNESEAKKVGKIVGVDYIVYGSIVKTSGFVRISGRTASVETGEIVAISSMEIAIDDEIASLLGIQPASSEQAKSGTPVKTPWTVIKQKNDFDDVTVYTFKTTGTTTGAITIGYVKHNDPLKSYLRIGISGWQGLWIDDYTFEVKPQSGSIASIRLKQKNWNESKGLSDDSKSYKLWTEKNKNREFLDLLLNNEFLAIRILKDDNVQRFNTSALRETIFNQGLTPSELSKAISNEEF